MLNEEEKIKLQDLFKSSNKKDHFKDLYFLYGIAVHYACNIEYGLYLMLLGPAWNSVNDLDEKKVDEISSKLADMTLGALIDKIKRFYKLDIKQIRYLNKIRIRRNYLIHHFWGEYGVAVNRGHNVERLIIKLRKITIFFHQAAEWIEFSKASLIKSKRV
jgi:hypothetical protein